MLENFCLFRVVEFRVPKLNGNFIDEEFFHSFGGKIYG